MAKYLKNNFFIKSSMYWMISIEQKIQPNRCQLTKNEQDIPELDITG